MAVVLAIDAGTTGVRTLAVDETGASRDAAYREFPQHFPRPGWVEHDPEEIWDATLATRWPRSPARSSDGETVAAIGITNQRETVVVWDRATGRPLHRAIVWQDRRTAARCDELRAAGHEPLVRARTGLVLDPYFSATKLEWLLADGRRRGRRRPRVRHRRLVAAVAPHRRADGGVHATDPSNASRTLLFDIDALRLVRRAARRCSACRAPCLPEVLPSSGRFGTTDPSVAAGLAVPVSGIAGDQQAALFGQACFEPGHDEEHLRHRLVRAREPRADAPRPGRRPAHHRGVADRRRRHVRDGGRDLRHRRRDPVAARRARHHRRRRRDRPARRERARHRRRRRSCPRSPGSARRGGTRTRAAPSSASPAARAARTSRAPWSRRWRGRRATSSTR